MSAVQVLVSQLMLNCLAKVRSNPKPPSKVEGEAKEFRESRAYKDDGPGLNPEPKDSSRFQVVLCSDNDGYCLPRDFQCHNGLAFKEPWNDCPFSDVLKCCVR
ncbi:Hypothetical predicted protein [Podarcis lilfordi]|uniref:Uncharacterized protein n=1 Tax=Podarcis lilfordi TaxID=74358 RepID=A0AA35K5Y3_9SAUR|nr:Hypothetical predicted protein [Podarcis lilfordi]